MTTKRLFFALWPDSGQRERWRTVIDPVAKTIKGKPVDWRNWHVTLRFMGDFETRHIPDLLALAAKIEVAPFSLEFDRFEHWPRARVACLAPAFVPAELERLVSSLNDVLQTVGEAPPDRKYRPHISVSRKARAFPTERLAQALMTEWSTFELMESLIAPGGVTYVPLKQ